MISRTMSEAFRLASPLSPNKGMGMGKPKNDGEINEPQPVPVSAGSGGSRSRGWCRRCDTTRRCNATRGPRADGCVIHREQAALAAEMEPLRCQSGRAVGSGADPDAGATGMPIVSEKQLRDRITQANGEGLRERAEKGSGVGAQAQVG